MVTVLLALGTAFGLCMLLWLCYGWCLFPVDCPVTVSLEAEGEAACAERCLRGLCWLMSSGLLHGRILVEDAGLTPSGRGKLLRLIHTHPGIRLTAAPGHSSDEKDGDSSCPTTQ